MIEKSWLDENIKISLLIRFLIHACNHDLVVLYHFQIFMLDTMVIVKTTHKNYCEKCEQMVDSLV